MSVAARETEESKRAGASKNERVRRWRGGRGGRGRSLAVVVLSSGFVTACRSLAVIEDSIGGEHCRITDPTGQHSGGTLAGYVEQTCDGASVCALRFSEVEYGSGLAALDRNGVDPWDANAAVVDGGALPTGTQIFQDRTWDFSDDDPLPTGLLPYACGIVVDAPSASVAKVSGTMSPSPS